MGRLEGDRGVVLRPTWALPDLWSARTLLVICMFDMCLAGALQRWGAVQDAARPDGKGIVQSQGLGLRSRACGRGRRAWLPVGAGPRARAKAWTWGQAKAQA